MSSTPIPALLKGLACLLIGSVVLLLAKGATVDRWAQENSPPQDLSSLLVDVTEFYPNAVLVAERGITPWEYQPNDDSESEVERSFFVNGHIWVFEIDQQNIAIGLFEFRQRGTALSLARAGGPPAPDMGQDSFVVSPSPDIAKGYSGVVGRINMQVVIPSRYDLKPGADEMLRVLFLKQTGMIPILSDLSTDGTRWIGKWFGYVWGGAAGVVTILGLLGGVGLGLVADRGLREWLRNRNAETRRLSHQHDVTPDIQPILWKGSAAVLARIGVLGLVVSLALAWPGASVKQGLLVICSFVFVWQMLETLWERRYARASFARGRRAVTLNLVGGMASSLLLVLGVSLFSYPVAFKLMKLTTAPDGFQLVAIGIGISGLVVLRGTRMPISMTNRLLQPTLRRQVDSDLRAPILLLRSFQDDTLRMRPPFAFAGAVDVFSGESLVRFEEVIAWSAWQRGPLRAIGQPGTRLQPLGAVRDYFDSDSWQAAVNEIADKAQAFVLIAGRSPGLIWEISNIRANSMLTRMVLVFPPVTGDEAKRRTAVVCTALELNPSVLEVGTSRHVLALGFDDYGNPRVYTAAGRTSDAYVVALNEALSRVSSAASVGKPADWAYSKSDGPPTDLEKFNKSRRKISKIASSWIFELFGGFVRA